jgi:hypothetical protein
VNTDNQRSTDKIVRIECKFNNTYIYFSDGLIECVEHGIDDLEQDFSDLKFWRVHPNHLINPAYFNRFISITNKSIVMHDGTELPVIKNMINKKLVRNKGNHLSWNYLKRYAKSLLKGQQDNTNIIK